MEEVVDGDYQNYKAKDGAYVRDKFFGKNPETAAMVENQGSKINQLADEERVIIGEQLQNWWMLEADQVAETHRQGVPARAGIPGE